MIGNDMLAEQLIDKYLSNKSLNERKIVKGEALSGKEVAYLLEPKQAILIKNKRGVVIDVNVEDNQVELIYALGVRSFKERYYVCNLNDPSTDIKLYSIKEELTLGVKNAIGRGRVKIRCPNCNFPLPIYPGQYPKKCVDCGKVIEEKDIRKE